MKSFAVKTAIACAVILSTASLAAPGNRFAAQLLDAHNDERAQTGAERLTWSGKLAREAQTYADELARTGRMKHASYARRGGAGENLWMGSAGYFSADDMIGSFIEEKRHYRPGTFPKVSRTGKWTDVGHYTQIIWRHTEEVGCAVARGEANDFLVCRYWPAGNTVGVEMR